MYKLLLAPTKNIPISPSTVKALEHGRNKEIANFVLFDHPFPRHLGVHDEFILNAMLDFRLMPLVTVDNFVIAFNLNGPKCDTLKEVPFFLIIFLRNHLSQNG